MLRLPQSILFAIIALNITGFAVLLQLDYLFFNSPIQKFIAWVFAVAFWFLTYQRRHKYFTLL